VPFSCAARPPLLAISRCFSGDIDANPRRSLRPVSITVPSVGLGTQRSITNGVPALAAPAGLVCTANSPKLGHLERGEKTSSLQV
jgi:hypothetical protein